MKTYKACFKQKIGQNWNCRYGRNCEFSDNGSSKRNANKKLTFKRQKEGRHPLFNMNLSLFIYPQIDIMRMT